MSGPAKLRGKMFEPFSSRPIRPITVDQWIYSLGMGWREGKDGRPIYTPGAVWHEGKDGWPVCFNCGILGHVKKNCPGADCSWVGQLTPQSEPKSNSSEQWEVEAWVNGEEKKALIDTGCGKTLVRELQGDKKHEGLAMRCIHGDLKNYQTMWANVKVGTKERQMNIGVVPGLSREMLLGKDWVGTRAVGTIMEGLQGEIPKLRISPIFYRRQRVNKCGLYSRMMRCCGSHSWQHNRWEL